MSASPWQSLALLKRVISLKSPANQGCWRFPATVGTTLPRPGMKGKHVDPSVRPWDLKPGELPTTAKFGIDATIPEGIPAFRYERIVPAFRSEVRLEDYL